jgi:hypothetical protein
MDDIKTGVSQMLREERGENLLAMRCPVCRRRDSHLDFRTELENLVGDANAKGASGRNREAENTDAPVRGGLLRSSDDAG